jgi:hypothetical protein
MTTVHRNSSAGRHTLLILLGAVIGWVAAWAWTEDAVAPSAPPVRVIAASIEPGRPVPAWAAAILEDASLRTEATGALAPFYPSLADTPPRVSIDRGGGGSADVPSSIALTVEHPDPEAALGYGRWLADLLRGEITHRFRTLQGLARDAGDGAAVPPPVADASVDEPESVQALEAELERRRRGLEDLRAERRFLREEQLRIWGLITQARGRVESVRKRLGGVPPLAIVRKKLVEDPLILEALEDRSLEDPSRLLALRIEEEIPNPVYAHLSGLEAEAIAEGTGYQMRLDEISRDSVGLDNDILRAEADVEDLDRRIAAERRTRGGGSRPSETADGPAFARVPVQVLSPVAPRLSTSPSEGRMLWLGVGTLAGALAGWVAAVLVSMPGKRSAP